jgi:acetate CoA/acetoacetate CoA-transferase alpha subunit
MSKIITPEIAAGFIKDGMTLMVGGFLGNGNPERIIDVVVKNQTKDLTIIVNDTAMPDVGIGKLIVNKQVKKVITSHIGTNPYTGDMMNRGEIEIEFSPQGTLAERIRCGGAGLGGVLTPTGIGTVVAEGKRMLEIEGKDYLLELPLRADIAIIGASISDKKGNLVYKGTSRNFSPIMAMAANVVIAEAGELVEIGDLKPEEVHTPAIFVDYIVH